MKKTKRVFLILIIVFGGLAVVLDIAAVCMQILVSGENLLTMNSSWGYFLAVSYRWVTLAAVLLTVAEAALLVVFFLMRKRAKKSSEQAGTPAS